MVLHLSVIQIILQFVHPPRYLKEMNDYNGHCPHWSHNDDYPTDESSQHAPRGGLLRGQEAEMLLVDG